MSILAPNLKAAAKRLGLSDGEVARRVGLGERTYGFYATGRTDPKPEILVKIAKVLGSSPNELFGWDKQKAEATGSALLKERLVAAAATLSEAELELVVIQIEAVAAHRKRPKRRK